MTPDAPYEIRSAPAGQAEQQTPAHVQQGQPAIIIEGLCKKFGTHIVLDHFNLTVGKEENVVILGRSGVGKSVLIKCIVGLLRPDSGRILVFGKNIPDLDHEEIDRVRAKVGFLFQSNALYDSMTVRANLEFPLRRHWIAIDQKEIDEMVQEVLDNVGLGHTADMMPEELSGGMRKRIALARTLILKPEIILYDEPTTGLDPVTGREISRLIVEMQKKYHTASMIISHDMGCVKTTADRVALLIDGKCYTEGTYDALKRSNDKNIAQFFE
ncbi:MAG: ATP-binding cassette domain-containing protein [Bacteroidota bacterium]|nr:ATP-binding cassette domain-containing protein [Bacteroidota bacterium]MDP4215627.1 ATP-binding cassette domain-containing protein [Bacteroidota bacterium]MDP4245598.1 ATP-binding cassette domain-containing protein [Bacteroidota bacterium]MDP4253678.1 ATP-binding cassette domain-containing protein [Bacteroidota bacterium]MDP4259574.1 ATP-binding cassette domain-containing protein [Bacteroidota bacterium]